MCLYCLSKKTRAKKQQIKLEGNRVQSKERWVFIQVSQPQELLFVGYYEHQPLRLVQEALSKFIELKSPKATKYIYRKHL